jgi:AcrR family transcriptional regulator
MARISEADRESTLQATRQRLLEAAAVEFAHSGFSEANINRISESAGFAKGTVYNHFPSKQALILALVAEAGAAHVAYIAARVRAVTEPAVRLVQFYAAGFAFIEEYPDRAHFLLTSLYSPGQTLQEAMRQAYQPMFRLVAEEILIPGIDQGVFRAVDPLPTANLLMTVYLGTGSHVDAHGKVYMNALEVADFALHALQCSSGG